jgi:hypothetical protein
MSGTKSIFKKNILENYKPALLELLQYGFPESFSKFNIKIELRKSDDLSFVKNIKDSNIQNFINDLKHTAVCKSF